MGALTDKERAYCRYYVANGGNGTQAAISAGYAKASASVQSAKLQRKPLVKAEIVSVRAQYQAGTLHVLPAPGQGSGGAPPPLDGQVLEPGDAGPRRGKPEPEPTDPTVLLTRQFIVGQLVRNVAIAMGDEAIEQRLIVKATRRTLKAGADGEPLIQETIDVVTVKVTDRNGAVANQALNLLDQQLDKLKAERGTVPQQAQDFLTQHEDRLSRMRQATAKAATPA